MVRKAIRTEYNGIVFRSKSEAIFARCLDLSGAVWEYESATDAGHQWDFTIWNGIDGKSRSLVELKPTQPTECYISNLKRKVRRWHGNLGWPPGHESFIVYGSPFTDVSYQTIVLSSPRLEFIDPGASELDDPLDLLIDSCTIDNARSFRFDLHGGGNYASY